jgi:hypothetical protein
MRRKKGLQTAQKALARDSLNQWRGASGAYSGILKTLDSAEFCF